MMKISELTKDEYYWIRLAGGQPLIGKWHGLGFWVAGGGEWSLDRLRAPASASALSPSRA